MPLNSREKPLDAFATLAPEMTSGCLSMNKNMHLQTSGKTRKQHNDVRILMYVHYPGDTLIITVHAIALFAFSHEAA